jgi:hypothetical protein
VPEPAAERDDTVALQVLLELGERLRQRRDVRVAVLLGLRDERGAAQRQQLTGVVDGHRADVEVRLRHGAHRVSRSA